MPLAVDRLLNGSTYNWRFEAEPEPALQGRAVAHPRGRVVGGSSAINGMVYTRGHPLDFDDSRDRSGSQAGVMPMCCPISGGGTGARRRLALSRRRWPPEDRGRPGANPLNAAFLAAGRQSEPAGRRRLQRRPARRGFAVGEQSILRGERRSAAMSYCLAPRSSAAQPDHPAD